MEQKLAAVFAAGLSSVPASVLCAELGMSRQTFSKYRRRSLHPGPLRPAHRWPGPPPGPPLARPDSDGDAHENAGIGVESVLGLLRTHGQQAGISGDLGLVDDRPPEVGVERRVPRHVAVGRQRHR